MWFLSFNPYVLAGTALFGAGAYVGGSAVYMASDTAKTAVKYVAIGAGVYVALAHGDKLKKLVSG